MLSTGDILAPRESKPDPKDPSRCLQCGQELFFECDECRMVLGAKCPGDDFKCERCGGDRWSGPKCVCSICQCGLD